MICYKISSRIFFVPFATFFVPLVTFFVAFGTFLERDSTLRARRIRTTKLLSVARGEKERRVARGQKCRKSRHSKA